MSFEYDFTDSLEDILKQIYKKDKTMYESVLKK